jgi:hypothetical protein
MMMIVILARNLGNRSVPAAAVLVLMRRPAILLSGAAFVSQAELLSGGDGECLALLAGLKRLNPPAQK